tara:strand:- start:4552 stop:4728 length:177 start_codon:yes stop_codon:yes gene_type:complete
MTAVAVLRLLELVVGLAVSVNINVRRLVEMRAANEDGELTDAQRAELLAEAETTVEQL